MRVLLSVVLYIALALGANADDLDTLNALREGDMRKLNFHAEPAEVSDAVFTNVEGAEYTLADWRGKIVLLNFWATWCAPCRKEMPGLDALQLEMKSDDFEVVTLATGRNSVPGIERFFEENQIQNLPVLLDPKQGVAREMAVFAMPVTVILNRNGQEIARLTGEAEWNSDSAKAILRTLIES